MKTELFVLKIIVGDDYHGLTHFARTRLSGDLPNIILQNSVHCVFAERKPDKEVHEINGKDNPTFDTKI